MKNRIEIFNFLWNRCRYVSPLEASANIPFTRLNFITIKFKRNVVNHFFVPIYRVIVNIISFSLIQQEINENILSTCRSQWDTLEIITYEIISCLNWKSNIDSIPRSQPVAPMLWMSDEMLHWTGLVSENPLPERKNLTLAVRETNVSRHKRVPNSGHPLIPLNAIVMWYTGGLQFDHHVVKSHDRWTAKSQDFGCFSRPDPLKMYSSCAVELSCAWVLARQCGGWWGVWPGSIQVTGILDAALCALVLGTARL